MSELPTLADDQIEHLTLRATRSAALGALSAAHGQEIAEQLAEQHPPEALPQPVEP